MGQPLHIQQTVLICKEDDILAIELSHIFFVTNLEMKISPQNKICISSIAQEETWSYCSALDQLSLMNSQYSYSLIG